MPDPPLYNTRLRTNSQILPPRRLRHSPTPPPHRQRLSKQSSQVPPNSHPPPLFPPVNVILHPEDAANKTLAVVARAMLTIDNRAITIKDLSHLSLQCGLLCQNVSAASQAITTFIRAHLNRCQRDNSKPLLLSLTLTGTAADDRLAPALHSRTGGTSSAKDSDRSLTSFRRGTIVWYLSESAGAQCPFRREGISVEHITGLSTRGAKRKRLSPHTLSRTLPAPRLAMTTRTRTQAEAVTATATTSRPRVRLTLKLKQTLPSQADTDADLSESDLTDLESDSEHDSFSSTSHVLSPFGNTASDDDVSSASDLESSIQLDNPLPVFSQDLPPYPILSPSIPSPSCTTPSPSLAFPFVPFSYDPTSAVCSSHFVKFSSFRTALSNPPRDHRARSCSLPFSAASPPPDSEDEDEDYHNSMIGLRRGSVPLPLKKEEEQEVNEVPKLEPMTPKCVPSSVLLMKQYDSDDSSALKQELISQGVSTPLEVLPGFGRFSPEPDRISVKDEPTTAVLPPARLDCWGDINVKTENGVLDHEDFPQQARLLGIGTRDDPVRIEAVVEDVEVLGPESVRSREWDAAWVSAASAEPMEVDGVMDPGRSCTPSNDQNGSSCGDRDLRASPAETLVTASTSVSSPLGEEPMSMDDEQDTPILMQPFRPCDPPVVATVIEGIPVYHTLIAPGLSLLRRIDTSFVNLTPLITFLELPLSTLVSCTHMTLRMPICHAPEPLGGTWVPLSVAQCVARHAGVRQLPSGIRDVFLNGDLASWFPDALSRLVQLHGMSAGVKSGYSEDTSTLMKEVGIRVEDVFVPAECAELKQDAWPRREMSFELQPATMRASMTYIGVPPRPSSLIASVQTSTSPSHGPLNPQEESLFHSFVNFYGAGITENVVSSPSSLPQSLPVKPSVTATSTVTPSSAKEKENATKSENVPVARRKREKVVELPVRRSKRALVTKLSAPVTRSRSRGACSDGRAIL